MDEHSFHNPDAEYRIHPFWFWNGDMNEQEIERQIEEMADKGVGGFFLCARQGMKISYLSQVWFDKVRFAIEAAKAKGMQVWLYDEYPYPSGIAGGEVTLLHPEAKQQTMVTTTRRVTGGSRLDIELPWARVLYAKAVPVTAGGVKQWEQALDLKAAIGNHQADPVFQKTGLTTYNQKRFFTYRTVYRLEWEVPAGEWEVVVFQEKEIEDFKYYGTFVDPCHREAMQSFIRLTHERYARYVGDEFGKAVKGMFTDEIGLLGKIPWSPQLVDYFQERNGYSIVEALPALIYSDFQDAARIRYDYYQTIHLLLRASYHEQVYDWCEEHELKYVAEVPSVRMTTQRFSHVPGGDSAHEKLGRSLEWILRRYALSFRDNPKMNSSIARQLGRDRVLDECFHSVGWSMNLQDAKWMIDRLAALGTNFYCFHAFFYTLDGITQHDAPPSHFYQNPYWPHFRRLGDYTGRISYLMSQGAADIRIAMLDPTTSLWAHMANPLHHFDYGGSDPVEKQRLEQLKEDWRSLHVHLLRSRRDFDHLDPELLAEATVEDGRIRIGHAVYSVLILPPMTNLEQKAWEAIKRFLKAGGKVISFGLLPYDTIESGSSVQQEAWETFGLTEPLQSLYWGAEEVLEQQESTKGDAAAHFVPRRGAEPAAQALDKLGALLDELLPRAVTLECGNKLDTGAFLLQSRIVSDDQYLIFVSNQEEETWDNRLVIQLSEIWPQRSSSVPVSLEAELLDLETGEVVPLLSTSNGETAAIPLVFAPYQSRMIRLTRAASTSVAAAAGLPPAANTYGVWRWNMDASGTWRQTALSPNALRFERFRMTVGQSGDEDGKWVQAKTFIDQCEDLAQQREFPVSFQQIFGTPKRTAIAYPQSCRYNVSFYVERLPEQAQLLMDESAISGEWTLRLNGASLSKEQFHKQMVYDNSNCVCDVQHVLREGWNELSIEVLVQHDWDGVTDAIYLYGTFGVSFDGANRPVVKQAPVQAATLATESYYPGYPYYAGTLSFSRKAELLAKPALEKFELAFPDWDVHDCVEVLVNGHPLGVRPWSPYVWSGDTSILHEGDNEVEVRVTGTLIGLLEGKYFDYRAHRVEDI